MAWNEPGNGNKNPWDSNSNAGGPPDLDDLLKKFRSRFGGGGSGGGGRGPGAVGGGMIGLVAIVAVLLWLISGIYIVQPGERGVVMQFGKYVSTTTEGPHWRVPWPIQSIEKVIVDRVRNVTNRTVMLTKDENIVDVELAVQYRVSKAEEFLFNVRDPDLTLQQALQSAVREVVGKSLMDFILTAGRDEVADRTRDLLQETLDLYKTGIIVSEVNIKDAQPPDPVQGAFADAIKAREDEQRLKNEAEAYSNDVIPRAKGAGSRQVAEALGYRERVIAEAEGEASRFTQLYAEYKKAPQVTRDRLYLDTMNEVLGNSSKILIDVDKGSPILYLPLDQMIKQRSGVVDNSRVAPPLQSQPGDRAERGATSGDTYRRREGRNR